VSKVKIFTDSSADIPKELAKELEISIIPMKLHIDGETYLEGVTLTADTFYEKLRVAKHVPTTSQPSPNDFCEAYRKSVTESENSEILSIHLSSALSGTYQSAVLAKSMLEDEQISITVLDSKTATYALGMIVVAVARAAKEGKSLAECIDIAQYYMKNQRVFFVLDTLEYLQKGGRVGKASAMLGSLLNITPILSLNKQGEVHGVDKVRGKSRAVDRVFELVQQELPPGPVSVGILHGDNEEGAKKWLDRIQSIYDVKECVVTLAGPAIGTHAGPGLIACVLAPL
jgi:fatty acid kinase fatty acid binding subunit